MALSRWVATATFLGVVPAGIYLAYVGHWRGLYPELLVPVAFGVILAVVLPLVLFVVLPALRGLEE